MAKARTVFWLEITDPLSEFPLSRAAKAVKVAQILRREADKLMREACAGRGHASVISRGDIPGLATCGRWEFYGRDDDGAAGSVTRSLASVMRALTEDSDNG